VQLGRFRGETGDRADVGDATATSGGVAGDHHGHLRHQGVEPQRGFDLALLGSAGAGTRGAEELDVARRGKTGALARPPGALARAARAGNKALRRQVRPAPVAASQGLSEHLELARDPQGNRPLETIQQDDPRSFWRAAGEGRIFPGPHPAEGRTTGDLVGTVKGPDFGSPRQPGVHLSPAERPLVPRADGPRARCCSPCLRPLLPWSRHRLAALRRRVPCRQTRGQTEQQLQAHCLRAGRRVAERLLLAGSDQRPREGPQAVGERAVRKLDGGRAGGRRRGQGPRRRGCRRARCRAPAGLGRRARRPAPRGRSVCTPCMEKCVRAAGSPTISRAPACATTCDCASGAQRGSRRTYAPPALSIPNSPTARSGGFSRQTATTISGPRPRFSRRRANASARSPSSRNDVSAPSKRTAAAAGARPIQASTSRWTRRSPPSSRASAPGSAIS